MLNCFTVLFRLLYPSTFLCVHSINFWELGIESPTKNLKVFYLFYSFIFGCAGSSLLCWLFSSCGKWGLLFIEVRGLPLQQLLCCGAQALGRMGLVAPWYVGYDQELYPCLLPSQVDSLPLSHQGSPPTKSLNLSA